MLINNVNIISVYLLVFTSVFCCVKYSSALLNNLSHHIHNTFYASQIPSAVLFFTVYFSEISSLTIICFIPFMFSHPIPMCIFLLPCQHNSNLVDNSIKWTGVPIMKLLIMRCSTTSSYLLPFGITFFLRILFSNTHNLLLALE